MYTQEGSLKQGEAANGEIVFHIAGFIIMSEEQYEDSKVSCSFNSPTEKLTLIPKYLSDENHLYVSVDKENKLHIGAIIKGTEKLYGEVDISEYSKTVNELIVLSQGTRFTVFYNEKSIFKFESALFVSGQVRLAGEVGETFYSFKIEEPQSIAWESNSLDSDVEVKVIVSEDDVTYMKLISSTTTNAYIRQSIALTKGANTLSFTAMGTGKALIQAANGTTLAEFPINESELNVVSGNFNLAAAQTITLKFESQGELLVGKEQIESGLNQTSYILNPKTGGSSSRKASIVRFPVKNMIDNKVGSLYMSITPKSTFTSEQGLAWADNDSLSIKVIDKGEPDGYDPYVELKVGESFVQMPQLFEADMTYNILGAWNDESIELTINEEKVEGLGAILSGTIQEIIFADEHSIKEEVVLEEWALFNNKIQYEGSIQEHLPYAVMQSLFNGGISGQNVTWSEIPVAPIDHSPILVQKESGDTLQKVSFFDHNTGEYVTYNQEPFVYDGRSDYVEVSYKNLDEQFRDIAIRTEDGEKIGEPYRIEGKRFYFNLYDIEKPTFKNKTLYAMYQVNDSYTIDYNIKAVDGYRINFAKHDGENRIVYQEGNRYGEPKKLATMVEMNPIQNQNHEGFLYITETVNKTDNFRITATPDRLHADGGSFSTLVIEPLDYQGNFISHSNLEIVAERGFITRHVSKDAVEAQKRSGQYLYQYYAPFIQTDTDGELVEDYIWITDKDSNIGIGYKMLLSPVKSAGKVQLKNSVKSTLTAKSTIIDYLLMYEGLERYEDEKLFAILDLNQDDRINMDEVTVLESNQKDQELTLILNQLQEWEDTKNEVATA